MSASPERVIRQYLEQRGGSADVPAHNLLTTWQLESFGAREGERIERALEREGISVDPPLGEVGPSSTVTLVLRDRHEAPDGRAGEIRQYLERRGGSAEVPAHNLLTTWQLESFGAREGERIERALGREGISVDPPLTEVGPTSTVTLILRDRHEAPEGRARERSPVAQAPRGGRKIARLGALLLVLLAIGVVGGVVLTGDDSPESGNDESGSVNESSSAVKPGRLRPGERAAVSSEKRDGTQLEVAVVLGNVDDDAPTDTPPDEVRAGSRWVRATVRVRNLGASSLDDKAISFHLVDTGGRKYLGNDVTPVGPDPQFSAPVPAGQTRSGTVLFLVRGNARPKEITWELLGDVVATWAL